MILFTLKMFSEHFEDLRKPLETTGEPAHSAPHNHIGLNHFLQVIGAVDSPLCSTCQTPETVTHYLLVCRRFHKEQWTLRRSIRSPLSLSSLIVTKISIGPLFKFIFSTKRFIRYKGEIPDT